MDSNKTSRPQYAQNMSVAAPHAKESIVTCAPACERCVTHHGPVSDEHGVASGRQSDMLTLHLRA